MSMLLMPCHVTFGGRANSKARIKGGASPPSIVMSGIGLPVLVGYHGDSEISDSEGEGSPPASGDKRSPPPGVGKEDN